MGDIKKDTKTFYSQSLRIVLCLQRQKVVSSTLLKKVCGSNTTTKYLIKRIRYLKQMGFEIRQLKIKGKTLYYLR